MKVMVKNLTLPYYGVRSFTITFFILAFTSTTHLVNQLPSSVQYPITKQ
jgi:hypothetical protein